MDFMELLTGLREVLELGWPGIVLVMCWLLWRAYTNRTNEYIDALREIAGLKPILATQPAHRNAPKSPETAPQSDFNPYSPIPG